MLQDQKPSKFCYRYDIRTNLMKRLSNIQIPRSGFAIAHLRNRIFAIAGSNVIQHTPINSIESYDITKDEWQHFTPLPDIRISPTAVVFQDRFIYVIGGFNYRYDQSKISDLIRLDLNQQIPAWQTIKIQNNVIPDGCQIGALPYINPEKPNIHQLLICGGLNGILFDDIYKLEVTIDEVENQPHDQDSQSQFSAQCIQLNQKLKSPDRLYFNQWLSQDQKHHSTNWILVGRESLHLFQFDKDLTQVKETSINEQNYKKLIE
ncbi:kelch motif family protein [Stylonychia lemnae]|uniref:Kelch motif family protein n=1 Tax=Stylonychia lemnae TaxID=5949 RepID=A0A078A3B0_STYLE|nr:kelch motif family protein [Stylonychia lemnae]|eukprot:CDW75249.1 kelch motif family protein [Stylonychia lemnae]